jgi:hypothetical protein
VEESQLSTTLPHFIPSLVKSVLCPVLDVHTTTVTLVTNSITLTRGRMHFSLRACLGLRLEGLKVLLILKKPI